VIVFRFIHQHRVALTALLACYLVTYAFVRSLHILVHNVSRAGEEHIHWIDVGDGFSLSPLALTGPASYFLFSPLRWGEAWIWQMIPRHYAID